MRGLVLLALLVAGTAQAQPRWPEFRVIMWSDHTAAEYATLAGVGVNAAKVTGSRAPTIDAQLVAGATAQVRAAKLPYYVENLATDFYAPYHRWTPEHPQQVTWLMDELRKRHFAAPEDQGVWERQPSLSDEAWMERIRARLAATVRLHAANRPLFYNLGDETGIADLTSAWDFDYSPVALADFRAWLRTQYGSLGALNAEWGTGFAAWEQVMPQHTTEAMARADHNYAAWSDFQDFMDFAFARALRAGTEAVHAADGRALAGMEGAQVPGRGGYDYTRLPAAVDVMELWAQAGNLQMARAVNPALVTLTTVFGAGPQEVWNIWRAALLGMGGVVIWDDPPFLGADGKPTERARGLAGVLRELTEGVGAQLLAAEPRSDAVGILYSPASQRLQWLLDRRGGGANWAARTAEAEGGGDDKMRQTVQRSLELLQHLGVQPRMLSPRMLEEGGLGAVRLLILPYAIALSDAEVQAIRHFVAGGGKVFAEGQAGVLDQHGRARSGGVLPAFPPVPTGRAQMGEALAGAGVAALLRVENPDGSPAEGVQVMSLRDGDVTLVGIQADFLAGAGQRQVVVKLPVARALQNLRGGGATVADTLPVTLDPVVPTLLAIAPAPLPRPVVAVVSAGRTARLVFSLSGPSAAATQVEQVEMIRPDRTVAATFRVPLSGQMVTPTLGFAPDDPAGTWMVRVRDLLGSGLVETRLNVPPP